MVKISPLLQSLLLAQIDKVVALMTEYDYYKAWNALKTLEAILPSIVVEEIKTLMGETQQSINEVIRDKQLDSYSQKITSQNRIGLICKKNTFAILRKTMDGLYAHGYLEWSRREEPGLA
jgi:hypothetical protein